MELMTVLIGVAVFIISALMIYCISAFSMREKTFEEVIAEQRQREEQERERVKAEKKAEKDLTKKKSFKKGKQEKVKEKSAQVNEPELKHEHKMVNLEIEPEVIEPVASVGLGTAVRQRPVKKEKVKSILVNKGEAPLIAEKSIEMPHKSVVPKDDVELKKAHEKAHEKSHEKVHSSNYLETPVQENKAKTSAEIKENVPPKNSPMKKNEARLKQSNEEIFVVSKAKQTSAEAPLNGTKLVSAVKHATLSENEVQSLIDILLNRQGLTPSAPVQTESWNKKSQKGDPVAVLKKQLEEKEKLLQEEKSNAMGLMARAKEMRNELTAEKTKIASLDNRYTEKLTASQAEVEALKSRMQHTHEQHLRETNTLQARLQQVENGGDRAQKLSEENKILQESLTIKAKESVSLGEKIKQLEREVSSSLSKVKASDAAQKGLESKNNMFEEKIRQFESMQKDVDVMVNQRVEEVSNELRRAEGRNTSLTTELQNATGALGTAQGEVASLKAKLEELERHLSKQESNKDSDIKLQEANRKSMDMERNVKNLEKNVSDLSKRLDNSSAELQRLQQENKSLSDTNKLLQDNLQNASSNKSNGQLHDDATSVSAGEHDRIMSSKVQELSELSSSLETQKKTISTMQAQLDAKTSEMSDLQKQLSQQKTKNNELREKNWKAMEALEQTEKSASEKVEKALKSARDLGSSGVTEVEKYDKLVFQGLFPEIKVQDKLAHKDWVAAFQKQAEKKLSSYLSSEKVQNLEQENKRVASLATDYEKQIKELQSKTSKLENLEKEIKQIKATQSSSLSSTVGSERLVQLEEENKQLQTEVDHYRSIVSDTESKLKQLEKSIDAEEKKWHEKLKQARSESQTSGSSKRVTELENLVAEKEGQVQQYRQVLSMTEDSLNQLEKNVSAEEKKWQDKLSATQTELQQTKAQLASLKKDLTSSGGSQEMKAQVERLEKELRESHEKVTVIEREKEVVITQLKEKHTHVSSADSSNELNELRTQLDAERKKNKDLSMNIVKLNGIIKTGQDALSQEQGLVKKLQQSLDTKSMSSGISDLDEMEQATTGENGTSV